MLWDEFMSFFLVYLMKVTILITEINSQMTWSEEHDAMLGREVMLFEFWKYKAGNRES